MSKSIEHIMDAVKTAAPFGPFRKTSSTGDCYLQWHRVSVENIDFHYEVIIGKKAVEGKENRIYAEFHMEGDTDSEPAKILAENIKKEVEKQKLENITCFPRYTPDKGLAIRYGAGVEITDEKIIDQLADQMTNLYTEIDNIVYSFVIKYTFKGLFDSSDTSAEKFLIDFNKRICDFYNKNKNKNKNGMEMASFLLIKILEQVNNEYFNKNEKKWRLPFGKKSAKRVFDKDDVTDLFGDNSKEKETILIEDFIKIIKNKKFLISPFSFWSIFFSHNNAFVNSQRPSVLSSLLNALGGDESNREKSLIDLRDKKARQLSKQKKGEEKDDLTIEGWTQLVDKLSEFAESCWKLFKEVMADNPNKDTINGYIQYIKTKAKNGENANPGCDGVGNEAVPNILPFIRPDLKFDFDNNGNIMSITKTEEVNMEETIELLKNSYQIILTGAPGTGKTYLATEVAEKMIKDARTSEEIAKITEEAKQTEEYKKAGTDEEKAKIAEAEKEKLTEEEKKLFQKVQFHPGYDYSDFIIGLKPIVNKDGQVTFEWKDGVFKKFSDDALKAYIDAKGVNAKPYIFIIDEINRADLSRVFGEVFSLLEEDYRYPNKQKGITLPSGNDFILSPNLYIIGTMNDIDRSVESMDFALRRRFSWKEVTAEESTHIIDAKDKEDKEKIEKPEHRDALKRAMVELNKYIGGEEQEKEKLKVKEQPVSMNLGEEYKLGGAYFLNFAKYQKESNPFESLWNNHIAIILNEYLRGRSSRQDIVSALKKVYDNALTGKSNADNAKPADDKKGTTPSSASETAPDGANQ